MPALSRRRRLRRSDCSSTGIGRTQRGQGFSYTSPKGARLKDPEALLRIKELAIPSAWEDVWICRDPPGHLQATGVDDEGGAGLATVLKDNVTVSDGELVAGTRSARSARR